QDPSQQLSLQNPASCSGAGYAHQNGPAFWTSIAVNSSSKLNNQQVPHSPVSSLSSIEEDEVIPKKSFEDFSGRAASYSSERSNSSSPLHSSSSGPSDSSMIFSSSMMNVEQSLPNIYAQNQLTENQKELEAQQQQLISLEQQQRLEQQYFQQHIQQPHIVFRTEIGPNFEERKFQYQGHQIPENGTYEIELEKEDCSKRQQKPQSAIIESLKDSKYHNDRKYDPPDSKHPIFIESSSKKSTPGSLRCPETPTKRMKTECSKHTKCGLNNDLIND
ncbi:3061_t:CDS:1, partial [Ambispora leptoticha]